jgi:hypothetical protein
MRTPARSVTNSTRRANQFRFSEILSSPGRKNKSLSISANQNYKLRHLIPEEGRRPSPPNVGMGCGGRGQRRRFFAPDEALSAYGEVVWSWRRDAGAKPAEQSAGDGDNKPAHRGEHDISRKAIAQGMSECSPLPCMLVCAFVCATGTRDRGCSAHPAFPAPSLFRRGTTNLQSSGKSCRENGHVCFHVFASQRVARMRAR